jgi:hypothetical protein
LDNDVDILPTEAGQASPARKEQSEKPYEVHPYSIETLKKILAEEKITDRVVVDDKLHCLYFEEYFDILKAKTIVVEKGYVDHDYLDDFTGYYVRCYKQYRRRCNRLHFFKIEFDDKEFEEILKNPKKDFTREQLLDIYLGFVVVKPLPKTIIGRTCLKTFPHDGRRCYPITRCYKVNLFGWELEVKSLAFQEQDKVLAACSTSALWSVLQGTGKVFHHHIPSPVEITNLATELLPPTPPETRSIPNRGLTITQMAYAIKSLGLVPFFINPKDDQILKNNVYGYLRGHIPILMTIALVDFCNGKTPKIREGDGRHAVAITGYSLGLSKPEKVTRKDGESGLLSRASRIDKLYVHDDQVGPFVRMEFSQKLMELPSLENPMKKVKRGSLSTSWKCHSKKPGHVRAIPVALMVPLYHKIRIPFCAVFETIASLDTHIERFRKRHITPFTDRLEWDIYLTTINEFKTAIRQDDSLDWKLRRGALIEGMPRFMWRATARSREEDVLDLLFDATDIEQGSLLAHAIGYSDEVFEMLRVMSQDPGLMKTLKPGPEWKILNWFSELPKSRLVHVLPPMK